MIKNLYGRAISEGSASGTALCCREPIGFFGLIDPETGIVTEEGHELSGLCIAGKVLVFPGGKGSTVGSYAIYALKWHGAAPCALVMSECEPIIAAGAVMAGIPAVDRIDISQIRTGDTVKVDSGAVAVERKE